MTKTAQWASHAVPMTGTLLSMVTLDELVLDDGVSVANILPATTDGEFDDDIDGAPTLTLTVRDPDRALLRSKMLSRFRDPNDDVDLVVRAVWYRMVQVRKRGRVLTLTFEDRSVVQLRQRKGKRVFLRGQVTRAEAAQALIKEPNDPPIKTWIPELRDVQPIVTSRDPASRALRDAERDPGLAAWAQITVKHKKADAEQRKNISRVLDVGRSMKVKRKGLVACVMAMTQESVCRNLTGGDRDSVGLFQIRRLHIPRGEADQRRNLEWQARWFFVRVLTTMDAYPLMPPGEIAQAIEMSGHPTAYAQWRAEAEATVTAYLGGGAEVETTSRRRRGTTKYLFERKKDEDSWDCLKRWASEVNWRRFASNNWVYFMSEPAILASRALIVLSEQTDGVDAIDFDIDYGKQVEQATVTCRADWWQAPSGTCVELTDMGVADGRWIVSNRRHKILGTAMTITLKRPTRKKKEPIATQTPRSANPATAGADPAQDSRPSESLNTVRLTEAWGGSESIIRQYVDPFMKRRSLNPGSRKRQYNTGKAVSDHWIKSLRAYATDYPTRNGEATARALAKSIGFNGWEPNNYTGTTVTVSGKQFKVQILWGSQIDHDDHIHVGVHRI